jgi:DNA polymerase-3 subunit gamma/tau
VKEGTFVDVVEIDAASYNSVDNVRDLRDGVMYPPAVGRKKVYIIDEVHMFSKGAFNALLKTLEEPPEHVTFILCTTEPARLPATILSRCLRLDFRHVAQRDIEDGMRNICSQLGAEADDDALSLIAAYADGSVRDGLSLLEQCVSTSAGKLTRDIVLEACGSPGDETISQLVAHVSAGRPADALVTLAGMLDEGKDESRIIGEWIEWFHSALLIKFAKDPQRIIGRSSESIETIRKQSEGYDTEFISGCIYTLSKLLSDCKWSPHPKILLEMAVIEMAGK